MTDEPDLAAAGASGVGATFGDLLRSQRRAAGLTQEELAERSGLSVRGIADLERGARRTPRRDTVALLVAALGVAPEDEAALVAAARRSHKTPTFAPRPTPGDPRRHNLPAQTTALLGRDVDIRAIIAMLRRVDVRLVTLTGLGGAGKTRLSIETGAGLVEDFSDGAWFVRLSNLTDPRLVIPTIARTLGLKESGGQPIAETLRAYLANKRLLLILDNCEHLASAAPDIAELLEVSPGLKALTTSRSPLRLRGEREYLVPPLVVPDDQASADAASAPERLADYPATALFIERARAVQPDFALTPTTALAVAAICAHLDGLPLAIELAAARVKLLTPTGLLSQLERGLGLLSGGPRDLPERQQTMGATLAWSERLLTPDERTLFRRLAVFAGGATVEAVEAVCASPTGVEPLAGDLLEELGALVNQSLAQQRADSGEPRFSMLRVVREYALARLETSGEAGALRRAHAHAMLELAERAEPELTRPDAEAWLDLLEHEHDNLRGALAWARDQRETETGQRLVAALFRFWMVRGRLREGRTWAADMLASPSRKQGVESETTRARALRASGVLALYSGDDAAADAQLAQAVALARECGDLTTVAYALSSLGVMEIGRGGLDRAEAYLRESLALTRELGMQRGAASALTNLGIIPHLRSDYEQAAVIFEEALALGREVGDRDLVATNLANVATVSLRRGDITRALALTHEALALYWALGDPRRCAVGLESLAGATAMAGDGARAARLLGAAAALRMAIGAPKPPNEEADTAWEVADARAAMGELAWEVAYTAGHALTLEAAVAEALDHASS